MNLLKSTHEKLFFLGEKVIVSFGEEGLSFEPVEGTAEVLASDLRNAIGSILERERKRVWVSPFNHIGVVIYLDAKTGEPGFRVMPKYEEPACQGTFLGAPTRDLTKEETQQIGAYLKAKTAHCSCAEPCLCLNVEGFENFRLFFGNDGKVSVKDVGAGRGFNAANILHQLFRFLYVEPSPADALHRLNEAYKKATTFKERLDAGLVYLQDLDPERLVSINEEGRISLYPQKGAAEIEAGRLLRKVREVCDNLERAG